MYFCVYITFPITDIALIYILHWMAENGYNVLKCTKLIVVVYRQHLEISTISVIRSICFALFCEIIVGTTYRAIIMRIN